MGIAAGGEAIDPLSPVAVYTCPLTGEIGFGGLNPSKGAAMVGVKNVVNKLHTTIKASSR